MKIRNPRDRSVVLEVVWPTDNPDVDLVMEITLGPKATLDTERYAAALLAAGSAS